MTDNSALRQSIQDALQNFSTQPLATGAIALLHALGYSSDKTAELGMSCPTNFVFQRSRRTIDATRGRTT